ncbi:MAG TPA: acyltransferase [Saprospiraceae bacterium]|nr:acyltransferase [Saprospiraceae bacterium]HND89653.1 acyltransferase [Saprospiraceae bacterium]
MPASRATHFHSIDALRALAAVAVCLYHFTYGFLSPEQPLRMLSHYGYLGVQAFFVISGFVVPLSFAQKGYAWRAFPDFFRKRAIRIEPAYWASIGLMLLMDVFARFNPYNTAPVPTHSWWSLLLHIPHANAIAGQPWVREIYWTLAIDWQFYLFVCLAFPLLRRGEWWLRYPLLALFCALHLLSGEAWLGYHAMPFVAGLLYFHYQSGHGGRAALYLGWAAVLAFTYWQMGITHTLAIGLSLGVMEGVRRVSAAVAEVGKISYSIYLTHVFSGWTLCSIFGLFVQNEWWRAMFVLLATAVSVAFARYFYGWVEAPTQHWARKG